LRPGKAANSPVLFVNYTGRAVPIYGSGGVEAFRAHLYVSAIGASGCAYAEVTRGESLPRSSSAFDANVGVEVAIGAWDTSNDVGDAGLPRLAMQARDETLPHSVDKRPTAREQEENAMTRAPMKLDLKKNRLHKDVGKAPGVKITKADIAKEKSKGGVFAKRAQFAENAKKWNHPGKGKR
jgi:hypothetical protein